MSARNSQRPESRASTTSATSHTNDLLQQSQQDAKVAYMNQNPEAALLHYQSSIPPQPIAHYDAVPQHHLGHQHAQSVAFPVQAQYGVHDSPYMQQDMTFPQHIRMRSVPVQASMDLHDDKRRKGSAQTATNDKELREMLAKSEGRSLREVAQEVIQKERTPMAEKTKQLFAMLWLRAVCKPAKTSVPRNRVYSQYATRCGTERVIPLNPASFGKLVRVIFPGIQTRRLGVRGESKYHYVDLALEEEPPNMPAAWQAAGFRHIENRQRSQSVTTQQIDFNNIPRLQADTAAFPAVDGGFEMQQTHSPTPRGPASKGQSFIYPTSRGMQRGSAEALSYTHTLRFPSSNMPAFSENESVNLPSIHPYLPSRTDIDTAEALSALYRTHCTSLIDSIRFCKEKQFFRLYTSFHGTLTVPVQKLFTHSNLAPWIEQCDLVMYRTMVRFVSRLTLQAAPVVVINILSKISATLHDHIARTFANQPPHVLEAKLRPATVFAGLLHRLIRVNQSAHAAANLLTIDQNREQMWQEWVTMVNPKRVMEAELPNCGFEEVYKIMTTEMRSLLEPLSSPAYNDDTSLYSFEADNGGFASFLQGQTAPSSRNGSSQVSTENVLDRWSTFLSSLPARFPHAPARTLLHCISAVGTSALRDITIMSGLSYGHWWVLKIFVDEMALWLAEMGGFLEPTVTAAPANGNAMYQSPVLENGTGRSHSGSRMSSMGPANSGIGGHEDNTQSMFMPDGSQQAYVPQQQQPHAHGLPFQPVRQTSGLSKQHQPEPDIDDSGIGMSLMDDDLTMSKFGVTGPHVAMDGMGTNDMGMNPL
ncbi:Transcriptional regulator RFX1 [Fulvia fulva]|uniref:Transcriptional regulator RFX1 n=1 Tax=Passalora fulva TaxID=5499 RepID=A0A9Q8P9X5_PASFU|nr:Transcriptional regulator RFX1 [Fulvia fulva]UJO18592.1 Transcriptional regulator RFX1 [Fulvia fulva]